MDIVNPIPPKNPTPIKCLFLISLGKVHKPIATDKSVKVTIPIGFPNIKPTEIPKLFVETKPSDQLSGINIPVLAKAKRGKIKNATGKCN